MIAILQEVKTGQAILKEYADRNRAYITESERIEVVNIAYNYLVRTCVVSNWRLFGNEVEERS